MINKKAKVLGVDYGTRRIGIAITDNDRSLVFPRGFLKVSSDSDTISQLNQYCKDHEVSLIVLGIPYLLDMKETNQTRHIRDFAIQLSIDCGLEVELVDESMSSQEADEVFSYFPKEKKIKNLGERDSMSAQIILKRWLDGGF